MGISTSTRRAWAACGALFVLLVAPAWSFAGDGAKISPRVLAVAAANPGQPINVLVALHGDLDVITAAGGTVRLEDASSGAVAATVPSTALARLALSPKVDWIAPDAGVLPTDATVTAWDPARAVPYAAVDRAPQAWAKGYDGAGVGIAVIDSGVNPSPDLEGRLTQVSFAGHPAGDDTFGHGSFVAGVAAGRNAAGFYAGVAPGARVYSLNVAAGGGARTADVVAALHWVTTAGRSRGIRVALLDLTETLPTSYRGSILDAAVEHAWRNGIVVVAAAGNLGPGSATFAPANDPFAIVVGALDNPADRPASFSTSGPTPDGFARPDLLAPGRHIVSTLPVGSSFAAQAPAENLVAPGYGMANGTSFAAPQVAGAAAILLQRNPRLTPDQVKWLLTTTGRPVDGGAALDVAAALALADTPGSANVGLQPGNCANRGNACDAPGSAYLHLFDWETAIAANDMALDALATWSAVATWGAAAFWSAAPTWSAAATWGAAAFWSASPTWNAVATWG